MAVNENHINTSAHQEQLEGQASNNKRIAKNTLILYIRMVFLMAISLYTSRVVLMVLGVSDYGIYNAVGGVVAMFSVLSTSLATAVSRFLTFELGRGDIKKLKRVFATSVNVQILLAVSVSVIALIVGGWFLNVHMNIPEGRMKAANWVLVCSVLSFAVGLLSVPYNASIISHEKMSIFAYISILEASLKLAIVFTIGYVSYDKLTTYAVLLLGAAIFIRLIYGIYCKRVFEECTYHFILDKSLLKEMTSFAGWNFLGNAAWMFNTQGINILINLFFGVTLNAARGVAAQVESAVMQFVNNFMLALNPQITKSYAIGDLANMHQLVCRGARFSFFLVILFAIPICLETERILSLWLNVVPDYAVIFVRLTFLSTLCTVLGNTLVTAQLATGDIKRYQIIISLWGVWVFPLTWLAFKLGGSPIWAYVIYVFIYFVMVFIRIYLVKDLIKLSWKRYVSDVVVRCIGVSLIAALPPAFAYYCLPENFFRFVMVCLISLISSIIVIGLIGIDKSERTLMKQVLKRKLSYC